MNDCPTTEPGLSVSFNFLKNPASAGFLLLVETPQGSVLNEYLANCPLNTSLLMSLRKQYHLNNKLVAMVIIAYNM
jgi:hypothetical protein